MGLTNKASTLLALRRLFLWMHKNCPNLIFYLAAYIHRLFSWLKAFWTKPMPSSDPSGANSDTNFPETTTLPCVWDNVDTLSLDGIATSLHPFSNGDIQNISSSSGSVHSSSDSLTQSRNASTSSSRRPASVMSGRSAMISQDIPPVWNPGFEVDPNSSRQRLDSTHSRRFSVSTPPLLTKSVTEHGIGDIEVSLPISPGDYNRGRCEGVLTTKQPVSYERNTDSHRSHVQSIPILPESLYKERYIRPVFPCETKRDDELTKIPNVKTNLTFPPITLDYSKPVPPEGWDRYAHPEGARYFHNKNLGIYTDAEIYDPAILTQVEADYAQLKAVSTTFQNPFPPGGEFIINVYRKKKTQEECTTGDNNESTENLVSEYYCVDHATRLIFFLKDFRADWMDAWYEIKGVRSAYQLQIELLAQYWYFVSLYPNTIELKVSMIRELRDIVVHHIGASACSTFSATCFPLDTLYKTLSLASEMERNAGPGSYGSMCVLASNLYIFSHCRFLNFHGEPSARIERDSSVYDDQSQRRRTWLIKTLSFVLFSAPEVHLKSLHSIRVDGITLKYIWEESMKCLNDEWQEYIIFATVVLNANVAFLAIQSVDTNHGPYRSPAQILSYLSIVADISSIILGLLLMRHNRTKNGETLDDIQEFLMKQNHPTLGLESLAILYSLPYALLMWGMVTFLAAFAFVWFQHSSTATRSLLGLSCFVMIVLTCWCARVSLENKDPAEKKERASAYMDPNSLCEELMDEDDNAAHAQTKGIQVRIQRLFLIFLGIFRPRRESYDSGKTTVEATDV